MLFFKKIAFTHTGRSVGWVGWFCFRLKSVNQLGWLWTTSFDLSGILVGRQHLPRIWFSHDDIRIARERSQQNKHIWDFCWSHMCQCPINKVKSYSQAHSQQKYTQPAMRSDKIWIYNPTTRERRRGTSNSIDWKTKDQKYSWQSSTRRIKLRIYTLDIKTSCKTKNIKTMSRGMRKNKYSTWTDLLITANKTWNGLGRNTYHIIQL